MMDALTRVPLSQRAAQSLLDEIANGTWDVGDQLPGEMTLASELGVGRSTIREAIRQLVARRVLVTRQGVGVFVAAVDAVDEWNRLAELAAITDVVQVRVAIESRAAALAADHRDSTDVAAITRALEERNAHTDAPPADLAARDIAFHRTVVAAAHNPLLLALFDTIRPRLVDEMTRLLELLPVADHDAGDHAAVVDAVLACDAERAENLTRTHLLGIATALGALS